MRYLFVSNSFPPYARGGYEMWCDEVATALSARGHTLVVLTAQAPRDPAANETDAAAVNAGRPFAVHRLLHTETEAGLVHTLLRLMRDRLRLEAENVAFTKNLIDDFRPDAVLIWGMWNICRAVPCQIEQQMGPHVAYYLSDYWPTLPSAYVQQLQAPARRANLQLLKSLAGHYYLPRLTAANQQPLRFEHPICVSRALRATLVERGVDVAHAQIIAGGTDLAEFEDVEVQDACVAAHDAPASQAPTNGTPANGAPTNPAPTNGAAAHTLRLLYLGRLDRTKGVHTLVMAMQLVAGEAVATLDIVGAGDEDYTAELRALVAQANLGECVRFLGTVQHAHVPVLLSQYDTLVFPSEWEEPFGRSLLEAMAGGLCVIGTATGGSADVLLEGRTGLTYPVGDAEYLATQIRRLAADPALRRQLGTSARKYVSRHFSLTRMVDELEAALANLSLSEV